MILIFRRRTVRDEEDQERARDRQNEGELTDRGDHREGIEEGTGEAPSLVLVGSVVAIPYGVDHFLLILLEDDSHFRLPYSLGEHVLLCKEQNGR